MHRLRQVSGSKRESVIREAFKDLLKAWGKTLELQFIPEHEYITPAKERRYIDGALLYDLRVPFGYWEAKDTNEKLDDEIVKKFRRGYPQTNIIFEDSTEAVLIQNGKEITRTSVTDVDKLAKLIELFFGYQRPEIDGFRPVGRIEKTAAMSDAPDPNRLPSNVPVKFAAGEIEREGIAR